MNFVYYNQDSIGMGHYPLVGKTFSAKKRRDTRKAPKQAIPLQLIEWLERLAFIEMSHTIKLTVENVASQSVSTKLGSFQCQGANTTRKEKRIRRERIKDKKWGNNGYRFSVNMHIYVIKKNYITP